MSETPQPEASGQALVERLREALTAIKSTLGDLDTEFGPRVNAAYELAREALDALSTASPAHRADDLQNCRCAECLEGSLILERKRAERAEAEIEQLRALARADEAEWKEKMDVAVTRAVLYYTAKGYIAGENTDSKHWRERAEAAEAKLAALSGGVSDCAICGGLVRFDGNEGDRIDPNCWGGRSSVREKQR